MNIRYIPCLDGLRAFAILLVIFSHLIITGNPPWFKFLFDFWHAGAVGVRLFFLISGFLITTILNRELEKKGKIDFGKFFMRRLLRIFPAFYFYLLVLLVLSHLSVIKVQTEAILFGFLYIQNLVVYQNVQIFPTSWFLKHSWSLSVEEQFYILYPFILKKLKWIQQSSLLKTMIVLTLSCSFFRVLNYSFPDVSRITGGVFFMHFDFLFYGGLLALNFTALKDILRKRIYPYRYWGLILALAILVISSRVEYYSVLHILAFGNLILFSNLYILLFFLLFPDSRLGVLFETKPLRIIGKLSYSLYIWQQLFLGSTGLWMDYKFLSIYPMNIIMVFASASFSYLMIEKPFLNLKKAYA